MPNLQRIEEFLVQHPRLVYGGLYLLAMLLRLYYLSDFQHSLMARVFLMDEAYYHSEAWNLIRGVPNATDSHFMTPVYPWFLSLIFRLAGDQPILVYTVQLLFGASIAPLTYAISRSFVRPAWSLVAAVATAAYAPLIFFEALLLVEWLVAWSLTSAFACMVQLRRPSPGRRKNLWAGATGLLLGLAVLGRGSNLLLAVPLGLWLWRTQPKRLAPFSIGIAVMLAPLAVTNAFNAKQPVLFTANAGFNLYVGNGPEATGVFTLPAGLDLAQDPQALRFVQRKTGRKVTASEASRFWLQQTLQWIGKHPADSMKLFVKKLAMFWNRFSFPQVEGLQPTIRGLVLGGFPFWHSYWVFPLALVGILWALRQGGTPRWLAMAGLLYSVSISLFFITDRYRVGILPLLLLFAVYLLSEIARRLWADKRREALGLSLAAGVALFLTSPHLLAIDEARVNRDILVHNALRLAKANLWDEALMEYRTALAMQPSDPEVLDGLARMSARAGQEDVALDLFHRLLQQNPDFARGWYNMANALRRAEQYPEAVRAYRRALELDPDRESTWNNLGETYRALGDTAAAADAYRQALRRVPAHEQALNNLGALSASQGRPADAEKWFRAAVEANPRYTPAWNNLALLYAGAHRLEEALEAWRTVLSIDPDNAMARMALEQLEEAADTP